MKEGDYSFNKTLVELFGDRHFSEGEEKLISLFIMLKLRKGLVDGSFFTSDEFLWLESALSKIIEGEGGAWGERGQVDPIESLQLKRKVGGRPKLKSLVAKEIELVAKIDGLRAEGNTKKSSILQVCGSVKYYDSFRRKYENYRPRYLAYKAEQDAREKWIKAIEEIPKVFEAIAELQSSLQPLNKKE